MSYHDRIYQITLYLKKLLLDRIPGVKSILGVYAVIVFNVYSWTLLISFYKLPSWMLYLSTDQILSIYAYAFLAGLVDSIFLLTGVLLMDYALFFVLRNMDEFQTRATLIVITVLGCSIIRLYLFGGFEDSAEFISGEFKWWTLALAAGVPLAVLISKSRQIRVIVEGFAERAFVFLYIYLSLSCISLMLVLFRNLS